MLFTVYTATLSAVVTKTDCLYPLFADDTQLHQSAAPSELASLSTKVTNCIEDVSVWMKENQLKMNDDKTELLLVTSRQKLKDAKKITVKWVECVWCKRPFCTVYQKPWCVP